MKEQWIRADRLKGQVLKEDVLEGFPCLTAQAFTESQMVEHLFSTRLGGVSEGIFATCNLSFSRGDVPEHVLENYERVAKALRCTTQDFVATKQTHTVNVRKVTSLDKGKGVVRPLDYDDVDGLITDEEGIALGVYTADCVPILFLDTKNRAIGVAHSGWRGTVGEISVRVLEQMEKEYGSRREDFLIAIGPSICQDCYEVSEDVAKAFFDLLSGTEDYFEELVQTGVYAGKDGKTHQAILPGRAEGKYQLDLWLANMLILRRAGISYSQMTVTDICTCHNPSLLFSHRASQGKRGNLGGFIMLKKI